MDEKLMMKMTEKTLQAWNNQNVDEVLACYTGDCIYQDPNTGGPLTGREQFGSYLAKLFQQWKMHWSLREAFLFRDGNGCAFLWHATLTPVAGGNTYNIDGLDLVIVKGELLHRNEVYFDRMALLKTK